MANEAFKMCGARVDPQPGGAPPYVWCCLPEGHTEPHSASGAEKISTWKVETTARGVILTINGKRYWTQSGEPLAFDLGLAARAWNGAYGG
jgi:hypothetical protein